MAEIINEIPEELEMEGEEVEVKEVEAKAEAEVKKEAAPVQEELDFDVEVAEKAPKKEAKPEQLELDFILKLKMILLKLTETETLYLRILKKSLKLIL